MRDSRDHHAAAAWRPWALAGLCLAAVPRPALAQAQVPAAPPAASTPAGRITRDCPTCPVLVTLPDGSAIGEYPVTREEFATFAKETRFKAKGCYFSNPTGTEWARNDTADWSAPGFPQTPRHPVVCVSWNDANAFADWLSKKTGRLYRLPSLEESTAAAAAGQKTAFWWGDTPDDVCAYANVADRSYAKVFTPDKRPLVPCQDGYVYTSPVGTLKPNGYGLYDMSGNVWQWTNSCLKGDCSNAVFRGGGWNDNGPDQFRLDHSFGDRITVRSWALGFRIFRPAKAD